MFKAKQLSNVKYVQLSPLVVIIYNYNSLNYVKTVAGGVEVEF